MSSSPISYANVAANGSAEPVSGSAASTVGANSSTTTTATTATTTATESSNVVPEESTVTSEIPPSEISKASSSSTSAPAKKEKKILAPAPVPTESVWGTPTVSASSSVSNGEDTSASLPTDTHLQSSISEKYPQLAEAATASTSSKSSLQKFIKPITTKWVPITAKVSLPNPRNNPNSNNSNGNSNSSSNNQQRQNKKNKNKSKNSSASNGQQQQHQQNGSIKKQTSQQSLNKKTQSVDSSEQFEEASSGEFSSMPGSTESGDTSLPETSSSSAVPSESKDADERYQQHGYNNQPHKNQNQQNYKQSYYPQGYDNNRQRFNANNGAVPNISGMQRNYRRYNNNINNGVQQYRQNQFNLHGQLPPQAPIDPQASMQHAQVQVHAHAHAYPPNGYYQHQAFAQAPGYPYNSHNNRAYKPQNGQYRPSMSNNNSRNYRNNGGYRQQVNGGFVPNNAFYPPSKSQIPPPISPKQDPQQALIQQIDYYFSLDNLIRDVFLRKNMDEEGWVPLRLILEFKRVKIIVNGIQNSNEEETATSDELILESVDKCENVDIKKEGTTIDDVKLRVKENFEQWLFTEAH